ncbi:MAG: DUF1990 domain-containing protein [Corynebacteriales bacterium]|uniref:DUF1990 domain-containing protein n=1 Tax=Williamsia herbipolensis TaxID=1603258 RepID=A0AAU4K469_9NOCA|nr:DUF1990 domain-containing protein [Williamsia herbipolensis]MCX6470329.1 DUF1990 domain-containing protein [Mycobacteriales bacterium]
MSRSTTRLPDATIEALRHAPFTYAEVGATADDPLPSGYAHQRREVVVGRGAQRFARCAQAVMGWQVQLRSGIAVATSDDPIVDGAIARIAIGVGPLRLHAPTRVVYVVDEDRRTGFAYGTLAGHPESGEESFVVEHRPDDSVVFVVRAFSRPGSLLTRAAGPLGPVAQHLVAGRYLRAVAGLPD